MQPFASSLRRTSIDTLCELRLEQSVSPYIFSCTCRILHNDPNARNLLVDCVRRTRRDFGLLEIKLWVCMYIIPIIDTYKTLQFAY